jgi:hypothetical protein
VEKRYTTKKVRVIKVENGWEPTTTDIEAYNFRGEPIHIKCVPALKNVKTGKVRVEASEVAKAEIRMLAKERCIEDRDIALLLMQSQVYSKKEKYTVNINLTRCYFING